MKFRVAREDLADAVAWVARSLPSRPPVPVLGGILLTVDGSTLSVAGFDYEVSTRAELSVDAMSGGRVLVSGRLLAEITRALPAKPVDVARAALAANPNGPDPALALMFAMAPKRAKVLAVPQGPGWAVVYLDTIIPGDATKDARTLKAARDDLTRGIGREMIQQFGRAMRDTVGVERNPTAIAKAKAQLSGDAPDTAP